MILSKFNGYSKFRKIFIISILIFNISIISYLLFPILYPAIELDEDISRFEENESEQNNNGTLNDQLGLILQGELQILDDVHYGRGEIGIYADLTNFTLIFNDVEISIGPKLVVYLSTKTAISGITEQPEFNSIYLGKLVGNIGNFTMNIGLKDTINIESYHSILIYCETFFTTFTYAILR